MQSWADLPLDEAWQLSKQEIKKIEQGYVVTRAVTGEGYAQQLDAFLLFEAPPEQVFSVITDYARLPEFVPYLDRVEVLEASAEGASMNYFLKLPFGVQKRYRLKLDYDHQLPDLQMSWDLLPWPELKPDETIQATSGYWLLKPLKNPEQTLLAYHTVTNPGDVPFGLGWIVDYLTNTSVIELLENIKERAEKQWSEQQMLSKIENITSLHHPLIVPAASATCLAC